MHDRVAWSIRRRILEMMVKCKSSHIGGSLSAVEILVALYFEVLHIDPKQPYLVGRDWFILSKGHAVSVLYATLAERGFFPPEILNDYYANGGPLPGHSSYRTVPGVEVSTGSLGHGLPIANGIALAGKRDKKLHRVFVLLSDGECDEGSNWEAILFAGHHRLDNLVVIVDYNKWQGLGKTSEVLDLEPFTEKWKDFGWTVYEVDGHDISAIVNALQVSSTYTAPTVVIAHTIKGKGVPSLEDTLESHYRSPTQEECSMFIQTESL